jgi:exonuclease 3'-5' domain-containing protein 1
LNYSIPRTLYLDLEGINLCREGTVPILTLLAHAHDRVGSDQLYLIDIKTLSSSAFATAAASSFNSAGSPWALKKILESPNTNKVFFDVRNDADALYAHFGIRMQSVMDLQLMENASRPSNKQGKRLLHGLAICVEDVSSLSEDEKKAWAAAKKKKGQRLFSPEKGGSFAVFNKRPLKDEIRIYCEQDVQCLPGLYKVYIHRLGISDPRNWMGMIGAETEKRLVEVMSESYKPHGRGKAGAPVWDINAFDSVEDWEDEMTAPDCPGWEDDMTKNGEW